MKQGWETRKIGDILKETETINPNLTPNKQFKYVDVSSVSNTSFTIENAKNIFGKLAPSRARKLILAGDIVFATVRPTLQRISKIPEEYNKQVCSTGFFVLRPTREVLNTYLYYYLFTESFKSNIKDLQRGTSYPAVTDSDIKNQRISYPKSLVEQQRIVAILDQAFDAIAKAKANTEKNLANARELFESTLNTNLSNLNMEWEDKKLGEIFEIERGGSPRPISSYLTKEPNGVNWIKIGDTKGITKYIYKTEEKIRPEGVRKSRMVYEEDFILSNSMSFGRPYIMKTTGCIHDGWLVLRAKTKNIDQDFLYYVLGSNLIFSQFDKLAAGSTVRNLNIGLVKSVTIPLPPLGEQQAIVTRLEVLSAETKKLEALYQQKLADLDELKRSILQKAFNGDL